MFLDTEIFEYFCKANTRLTYRPSQ